MAKGMIHIYTGDGKGKTTASLGLALRAKGAGFQVLIAQFLKGQDTAELQPLQKLGIPVIRGNVRKFIPYMDLEELRECRREQEACFSRICANAGSYDLVILDEIFGAISTGMICRKDLLEFINNKPEGLELVLTGRDAPDELIDLADYVSEIHGVKHPYAKGIQARKGIEF